MPVDTDVRIYLAARSHIRPVRQLLKDRGFWWACNGLVISGMAVLSGLDDRLSFGMQAGHNYFRMAQGALSGLNLAAALIFITVGRLQVYRDLADFQAGVAPERIIARADYSRKNAAQRRFGWLMHETHNNVAKIGIVLSALMLLSGLSSRRGGEAVTALFWIWAYVERLRRERHDVVAQTGGSWRARLNAWPLLKSALIQTARTIPALMGAVLVHDVYQVVQLSLLIAGLYCLSGSTKDGIGRYGGSLVSADTPNGLAIAKALLDGRLFKRF